nr:hypothetical protein Iba_scaffold59230CG0010 [Ipomoea batatas]GME12298.1 hypothetical protein Iba_scaffold13553CG0010 [Ipomoea batatas]
MTKIGVSILGRKGDSAAKPSPSLSINLLASTMKAGNGVSWCFNPHSSLSLLDDGNDNVKEITGSSVFPTNSQWRELSGLRLLPTFPCGGNQGAKIVRRRLLVPYFRQRSSEWCSFPLSPATQHFGRRQEWEAKGRSVDGERTGDLIAGVFSLISVAAFHISGGVGRRVRVTLVTGAKSVASADFPRSSGDVRQGEEQQRQRRDPLFFLFG